MCPSEVADAEHSLWQAYKDAGVQVWGIASEEEESLLQTYAAELGLTYPILMDTDGAVLERYKVERETMSTAFPHDWVVGTDGLLVYGSNRYEPTEIQGVLDHELSR